MICVSITTKGVVGAPVVCLIVTSNGVGLKSGDIPIVVDILCKPSTRPAQHFYEPLPRQAPPRLRLQVARDTKSHRRQSPTASTSCIRYHPEAEPPRLTITVPEDCPTSG